MNGEIKGMTKKIRLLALTRRHPFLSVDEIAETVGTTPRYVRTTLSEAGLSLLALRRQHAQRIAEGVRIRMGESSLKEGPDISALHDPSMTIADVRVERRVDPDVAAMLGAVQDTPLLNIHRLRAVKGVPAYVSELVTVRHVVVTDAVFAPAVPLSRLLGMDDGEALSVGERVVDTPKDATPYARTLRMKSNGPVLRIGYVLHVAGEPVAVKFHYFDGSRVHVVFPDDSNETIRIVDKSNSL